MSYLPRGVARCQHIKVNGTRCESPALKGKAYCYFHYRARLQHPAPSPILPAPGSQELAARSQELSPAGVPLNAEFFLLEDANSIQCTLQWVLRRILAASIDRREASLLLYGLQIAASNVKQTTFEPYYRKIIRNLPATEAAEIAEVANKPAQICPDCHPELGPGESIPVRANGPAFSSAQATSLPAPVAEQALEAFAPARAGRPRDSRQDVGATLNEPASSPLSAMPESSTPADLPGSTSEPIAGVCELPTDHCPLTTAPHDPCPPAATSRRKPSRRARTAPLTTDYRLLTTVRPALSLMFQREVKRHLARLNFPSSPESDLET